MSRYSRRIIFKDCIGKEGRPDHGRSHKKNLKDKLIMFKISYSGLETFGAFTTSDDRRGFELTHCSKRSIHNVYMCIYIYIRDLNFL